MIFNKKAIFILFIMIVSLLIGASLVSAAVECDCEFDFDCTNSYLGSMCDIDAQPRGECDRATDINERVLEGLCKEDCIKDMGGTCVASCTSPNILIPRGYCDTGNCCVAGILPCSGTPYDCSGCTDGGGLCGRCCNVYSSGSDEYECVFLDASTCRAEGFDGAEPDDTNCGGCALDEACCFTRGTTTTTYSDRACSSYTGGSQDCNDCCSGTSTTCSGTLPANADTCDDEEAGVTLFRVGSADECTDTRDCEYYCRDGYIYNHDNGQCVTSGGCEGSIPMNAEQCPGDFTNVPAGVSNQTTLVAACSEVQSDEWCEVVCRAPRYELVGGQCVPSGPDPRLDGVPWCHKAETSDDCQKLNTQFATTDVDGIGTACKWCPKPNNEAPSTPYLYTFHRTGGPRSDGRTHACVNVMSDPLNCGGCGFIESGNNIISSNNQGFCDWTTPYCIAGRCKNMADALSSCTDQVIYTIQAGTYVDQLLVPEGEDHFEFLDPLHNQDGNDRAPGSGAGSFISRRNRLANTLACAQEVKITEYTSEGEFRLYTQWPVPAGSPNTATRDLIINTNNLEGEVQRPDQLIGDFSPNDGNDLRVRGLNSFYSYYGIHGWKPISKPYILRLTPNVTKADDTTTYGRVRIETTSGDCIPGMFRSVSPNPEGKWGSEYCGADGKWSFQTPFGRDIKPIFTLHQLNDDPDVCTQMGGSDFSDRLGCCGDGKCRELRGYNCHVQGICDGQNWYDATDTETYGEIIGSGDCEPEGWDYLIANIEGEYVKCVDDEKTLFDRYVQIHSEGICIPNYAVEYTDKFESWEDFEGPNEDERQGIDGGLAGGREYLCGQNSYQVGGHRGLVEAHHNHCVGHPIHARYIENAEEWGGVTYICDITEKHLASGEAFAYAALLDAQQSAFHPEDSNVPYKYCPASVDQWLEETNSQKRDYVAMVPCPGKIDISENIDLKHTWNAGGVRSWSISVGGTQTRPNVAICASPRYEGEFIPGYRLQRTMYYPSNGTVMGSVANYSYACYRNPNRDQDTKADIAVCCGNDSCADIPGAIGSRGVPAGKSINASGKLIYCLNNGSWSEDLDFNYTQDVCHDADFFETGNYCCAEGDDTRTWINESYNDPGSARGACFKGVAQNNGDPLIYGNTPVNDTYYNVLVHNGSFLGCGFNNSAFHVDPEFEAGGSLCVPGAGDILSPECLQGIEDWPDPGANFSVDSPFRTNHSLIRATDYCTIVDTDTAQVYCSYGDVWNTTGGNNLSHSCVVPKDLLNYLKEMKGDDTLVNSSCCEPNHCWDPSAGGCIVEQTESGEYYQVNDSTAYRCLHGTWVNIYATGKRTPDGCFAGVCNGESDCFFSPGGESRYNYNVSGDVTPQCIADTQYLGDFVCDAGNWTTRTKILAQKLVSLIDFDPTGYTDDNFVVMCGMPAQVLNSEPTTGDTNTYCVMNLNGQRILGTTLNQPIYDNETFDDFRTAIEQGFGAAYPIMAGDFDFDYTCNDSGTSFERCIDIEDYLQLYFKEEYEMVVFSDEEITGLNGGLGDALCDALPAWLKWLCPLPSPLEQDLEDVRLFNMTFSSKIGPNKRVFGVHEQVCDPASKQHDDIYNFNYSGYTSVYLKHITDQIKAEEVNNSDKHIFIKNPDKEDAWAALTLLRNTELQ